MFSEPDEASAAAQQRAYARAVRMLAAREHTAQELSQKLSRKQEDLSPQDVAVVIARLIDEGLQSDARAAESLVRGRIARGYGPYVIRQDARAKGLDEAQIERTEAWTEVDWFAQAADVLDRKYPHRDTDPSVWDRAMRFAQRRGFAGDVVRESIGSRPWGDSD